jgi:hypothetical protein
MTVQPNTTERIGTIGKTKALAAGLLAAGMIAAGMMAASPAHAATTFTVNDTSDAPDAFTTSNTCDHDVFTSGDQCSLRAAIQQANATTGADAINFNIAGTGVKTIVVGATGLGALPAITEQVTIDGYTQPGSSPNTRAVGNDAALKIVLDGTNASGSGLEIENASNSVIKGLVINNFGGSAIDILGDSVGTRVEGNFLGTDPTGTLDRGNFNDGVEMFDGPRQTVIGGTTPAARNLISANGDQGIDLGNSFSPGALAEEHRIQGNYIGTDRSGTKDLGNAKCGVSLFETSANTLGGTTAASRNLLSGNGGGVCLFDASDTLMLGNRIGTTASGTGALGNDLSGVEISGRAEFGSNNALGDGTAAGSNTVAFNGQDGVLVGGASLDNQISRNSIFSNGGLGIDLLGPGETFTTDVPTPNDPGDADFGPNGLQNKPVVSSAKTVSGKTTVKGTLGSLPEAGVVIRFYSNPSGEEGKKFLGQKSVAPDLNGNASFVFSPATAVPVGQTVTATATSGRGGGTSEFSAARKVTSS